MKLTRDPENRCCSCTGGVCAGIALWAKRNGTDIDVSLVRVLFALVSLMTTGIPMLLIYIVLWALLPIEGQV